MKRKEAIELIANFLSYELGPVDARNKAKEILAELEVEGMLPPFSGKIRQEDIIDRWGQDTGRKEMARVIVNEWEEEEE